MPIVGTPTDPVIISKDQVRMFLRDRADRNILLDEVQFTDGELNLATEMAVSAINCVSPPSNWTPMSFPEAQRYVLLVGTARFLMMSESFLQIRNQATYADGDISPIGISDKMAQFSALAQQLKAESDELVRGLKTSWNMEGAYNTLGSGYRNVARRS